ncbi:TPA: DUF4035 domain-containing protein [Citrobacter freundii]|nr:DUF4035 domain-containing protein [Escherichia coli]HAU4311485.1 DUF4035 domain-containing protein [Citrobacter freundii]HCR3441985.1 DUF4035 domain-containing protein [Citrobacter freundii]HCR3790568.1 DUF4035 domain-containing protein [Citrobacter freundii]HCR3989711.1 DUF4035 domain-containing protein [Citrobacter freundii]
MRFLMSLALRMGRTLSELQGVMSATELRLWAEFDKHSPIGDIRGDIQAAQIATAVFNAQGGKATMSDMLLRWQRDHDEEEVDPFAGLEKALIAATQ